MSIQEKARWNLGDCSVREWLTYTLGYEERWFPLWRASFSSGWLIHYTVIPNASKCWTPLEFTHLDRMAGLGLMSLVLGSWCRPRIVLLAEGFIPGAWDEDFIDGLPTAFLLLDFGTGAAKGRGKWDYPPGNDYISHQTRKGHSFSKVPWEQGYASSLWGRIVWTEHVFQ